MVTLKNRTKWHKYAPDPKVGQLVVLVDELRARKQWKLGQIVEALRSGSDALVRTVRVRTDNGRILSRDIRKVVLLDLPNV